MQKILLLDYDHTFYASTHPTLWELDKRINLYIHTFLNFSLEDATKLRSDLCRQYGTTLQGLQECYGTEKHHYCDFIHQVEDEFLPPPNPLLDKWLNALDVPCYLFTNARRDWVDRGFASMQVKPFAQGILDIDFMDWEGKPHVTAYHKVETYLKSIYGEDLQFVFADDKVENLLTAQARHWITIWIKGHHEDAVQENYGFNQTLSHLTELNIADLP